jgi:hypothetical protein
MEPVQLLADLWGNRALHEVPEPIVTVSDHSQRRARTDAVLPKQACKLIGRPARCRRHKGKAFSESAVALDTASSHLKLTAGVAPMVTNVRVVNPD